MKACRITIRDLVRAARKDAWARDAMGAWRRLRAIGVPGLLLRPAWETIANLPEEPPPALPAKYRHRLSYSAEDLAGKLDRLNREQPWLLASELPLLLVEAAHSNELDRRTRSAMAHLFHVPTGLLARGLPQLLRLTAWAVCRFRTPRPETRWISLESYLVRVVDEFRTKRRPLPYQACADLIQAAYILAGVKRQINVESLRKNFINFHRRARPAGKLTSKN